MARTIQQIQDAIKAAYVSERAAAALPVDNPVLWSKVNIKRLWTSIIAIAMWALENIFDLHKAEVLDIIANLKPHTQLWYVNKAKAFRFGFNLLPDSDLYDNTGLTAAQIAAAQIIAHAAVTELPRGMRLKLAKNVGADLGPLSAPELQAANAYMQRVKDAGVTPLQLTTANADALKVELNVKYNPLVLNANGQRLDGTNNEPVQAAVKSYLKNLPFNGELELIKLIDAVQLVEGIEAVYILTASARYAAQPFASIINNNYLPDSGYLKIYDAADLVINFEIA